MSRWRKRTERTNDGKPIDVWELGDFEICQNEGVYCEGELLRFDFEVTERVQGQRKRIGLSRGLRGAKEIAKKKKTSMNK